MAPKLWEKYWGVWDLDTKLESVLEVILVKIAIGEVTTGDALVLPRVNVTRHGVLDPDMQEMCVYGREYEVF